MATDEHVDEEFFSLSAVCILDAGQEVCLIHRR
jgi:hypothetical protein